MITTTRMSIAEIKLRDMLINQDSAGCKNYFHHIILFVWTIVTFADNIKQIFSDENAWICAYLIANIYENGNMAFTVK